MRVQRLNPDGLHATPGYHHITVVEAGRTAYLAGQCPLDEHGALVGDGDLPAQVDQVVVYPGQLVELDLTASLSA